MNFHVLTIPQIPTTREYSSFPFNGIILNFCDMLMNNNQNVYYYGHEENDIRSTETINIIPKDFYYNNFSKENLKYSSHSRDNNNPVINKFDSEVHLRVNERLTTDDIVLAFYGFEHYEICKKINCINVEPSIGYEHTFSANKIYASNSHLSISVGAAGNSKSPTDVVIPHMFREEDFVYESEKDNYILFLGRICLDKGCHIVDKLCLNLGFKLKVAGPECGYKFKCNHEYVGNVGIEDRCSLLSKAKALIAPTQYFEPFGQIVIEALLSGTPVITTDWGAFPETNIHGLTGFRCNTYEDFVNAIENIDIIKPSQCRLEGEKYLIENLQDRYLNYMEYILKYYEHKH